MNNWVAAWHLRYLIGFIIRSSLPVNHDDEGYFFAAPGQPGISSDCVKSPSEEIRE